MKEIITKALGTLSKDAPIYSLIVLTVAAEIAIVYYPPEVVECDNIQLTQYLIAALGGFGGLLKLIQILVNIFKGGSNA